MSWPLHTDAGFQGPEELDTGCRDDIQCPYCGFSFEPVDDYQDGETCECEKCRQEFDISVDWSPTYYTRRKGHS